MHGAGVIREDEPRGRAGGRPRGRGEVCRVYGVQRGGHVVPAVRCVARWCCTCGESIRLRGAICCGYGMAWLVYETQRAGVVCTATASSGATVAAAS
jgi:hypothetical protein